MPALTIPKENVIGLAFEPLVFLYLTQQFVEYAQKHIGKYLIGEKKNLPPPFIEHFAYMWHITPLTEVPVKTKRMSIMVSHKMLTPGHQYRHTLCKRILNSYLPIDIYGNGCKYYKNSMDMRLKGEFTDNEPYENYRFHIAIENGVTPHYFSEKITNTLLCQTTPIYLGCQNIYQYFPNSVLTLTGDIEQDMTLLKDICLYPERYEKTIDVNKVKKTINFSNVVDLFAK